MLQVFSPDNVPQNVKRQVYSWQDAHRAATGSACFEFANIGDDVLVLTDENRQVSAIGLLELDQMTTDYFRVDTVYLAFFATRQSGLGRDALRYILEYAHYCGFELDLVSLQESIGFYEKCEFLTRISHDEFASVPC